MKPSRTARTEMQQEALTRAVNGQALTNFGSIFEGFAAMGIPADQIKPRENVFTFNAWKALGRYVKKGEHGVKVVTWVESKRGEQPAEDGSGETKRFKFCRTTTVFHISQTEAAEVPNAR